MKDSIKTAVITGVVLAAIVLGLALLNNWSNNIVQARCEAKGGEYYRAALIENSLCRLPNNG